jgi:hypothetical protein
MPARRGTAAAPAGLKLLSDYRLRPLEGLGDI